MTYHQYSYPVYPGKHEKMSERSRRKQIHDYPIFRDCNVTESAAVFSFSWQLNGDKCKEEDEKMVSFS